MNKLEWIKLAGIITIILSMGFAISLLTALANGIVFATFVYSLNKINFTPLFDFAKPRIAHSYSRLKAYYYALKSSQPQPEYLETKSVSPLPKPEVETQLISPPAQPEVETQLISPPAQPGYVETQSNLFCTITGVTPQPSSLTTHQALLFLKSIYGQASQRGSDSRYCTNIQERPTVS
jgi:hypothetical protein